MSVDREPRFAELEILGESVNDNAVNIWPLFLQDGETSSYLWPLIKSSTDHFAIRPIYNYDKGTHDLLLGIASADFDRDEYRLFPFLFHFPQRGFSLAFPLAYYRWPTAETPRRGVGIPLIFNWWQDTQTGYTTWWNFLLAYGRTEVDETVGVRHYSGFYPLYWRCNTQERSSNLLFPLYYQRNDTSDDEFYSITPLTGYHTDHGFTEHWFFPFYYAESDTNSSRLYTPLGWYNREDDNSRWHFLLTGRATAQDSSAFWFFPLYYRSNDEKHSEFYSLSPLTGYHSRFNLTEHWFFPFYYAESDTNSSSFYTPFGWYNREDDNSHWHFLLTGRATDKDSSSFWFFPLYYQSNDEKHSEFYSLSPLTGYHSRFNLTEHWMIPFYYASFEGASTDIYTPFGLYGRDRDSSYWHFLLTGRFSGKNSSSFWLFPAYFQYSNGKSKEFMSLSLLAGYHTWKDSTEHWVLPFYYALYGDHFTGIYTPLGSYSRSEDETFWRLLLLGRTTTKDSSSLWLFPLYYQRTDDKLNEFHLLTLLTGYRSRPDSTKHWVFPFYYSNSSADSTQFYTPLSYYSQSDGQTFWHLLLLLGQNTSEDSSALWLFPLYYQRTDDKLNEFHLLTLLTGYRSRPDSTKHWAFPFYYSNSDAESAQFYTPLSYYRRENETSELWTPVGGFGETQTWVGPLFPLIGTTRHEQGRSYWAMPLAYYTSDVDPQTSVRTSSFDLLWLLYSLECEHHPEVEDSNIDLWFGFGLLKWKSTNWSYCYQAAPEQNLPLEETDRPTPKRTFVRTLSTDPYQEFSLGFHLVYHQHGYSSDIQKTAEKPASTGTYYESSALAYALWYYDQYESYSTDSDTPTLQKSNQHLSLLLATYRHKERFTADTNVRHIEDYGLWGLLWDYESKTDNENDSVAFSILRYLYKLRQEPDGTRQQFIFPFIETRSAPDESYSASFLWRLWRFERDADGQTRHWLFFIPLQ